MYEEHLRQSPRILEQCLKDGVTHVAVQRTGASLSIKGFCYGKDHPTGVNWPEGSGGEWYLATTRGFVVCEEPFMRLNPKFTHVSFPFAETV